MKPLSVSILFLVAACMFANAQQVPDLKFNFENQRPVYPKSKGPVIIIDEAHLNFHTLDGRYSPFGKVLTDDGYILKAGKEKFSPTFLETIKILVIANPMGDTGEWKLPTLPAFSEKEVAVVEQWVKNGGNLFLIADHMPCAGAAANLAGAFGFNFINGFAFRRGNKPEMFSKKLNNLSSNLITNGRDSREKVDSIEMFTGSAFLAPPQATVITNLDDSYVIELASIAWQFDETTPKLSGRHFVNGAMLEYGNGRVVIFSEAAMFTAQLAGPNQTPMGMNQRSAKQNPQLLLNIIHWLDGKL